MSTVADVVAAIRAESSSSWLIADQLADLDELDEQTGKPLTLKQVSERIYAEQGVEWSPAVLGMYRTTATAFPSNSEVRSLHSFTAAKELRAHPDRLLKWKPKKPGEVLTVERARALRPPRSSSKASPTELRLKRLISTLYTLLDDAPELVITVLEGVVREAHTKYDRRIEREARRGLSVVS